VRLAVGLAEVPKAQDLVVSTRDDVLAVAGEGHGIHAVGVSLEGVALAQGCRVPDANYLVMAGTRQQLAVGAVGHAGRRPPMTPILGAEDEGRLDGGTGRCRSPARK